MSDDKVPVEQVDKDAAKAFWLAHGAFGMGYMGRLEQAFARHRTAATKGRMMDNDTVPVTQVDREAARWGLGYYTDTDMIAAGEPPARVTELERTFARHRIAAEQSSAARIAALEAELKFFKVRNKIHQDINKKMDDLIKEAIRECDKLETQVARLRDGLGRACDLLQTIEDLHDDIIIGGEVEYFRRLLHETEQ